VSTDARRFFPGIIDYNADVWNNYPAGRGLSSETADLWIGLIAPFIEKACARTILDLGAGTGRFSALLADSFRATVYALEPARVMAAAAVRNHARVNHVAGRAEQLPLRKGSCDIAWISQVYHHITDHVACARELCRVLRPSGRVLIRGTFADRLDGFPTLFRFFPAARNVCEDLPTSSQAKDVLESAGFLLEADEPIQQRSCASLRAFADRTRLRTDTSLMLISDREFAQGMSELEQTAAEERLPAPVVETLTFLAFRRL